MERGIAANHRKVLLTPLACGTIIVQKEQMSRQPVGSVPQAQVEGEPKAELRLRGPDLRAPVGSTNGTSLGANGYWD